MIRIYVILGLVIASLGGLLYVQGLRASNAALTAEVSGLKEANAFLESALKVSAAVNAKRIEDTKQMGTIKEDIAREPEDPPVPAPLARAFDGLREHRAATHRPGVDADVRGHPRGSR